MALTIAGAHLAQTIMQQAVVAIVMLTQKHLIKLHKTPSIEMAAMTQYEGKKMNIMGAKG
ncbi:MAG: hypothetical protein ABSH41_21635 [Syntrophobacteraceae bacterium]|jgi:hypothetical protein